MMNTKQYATEIAAAHENGMRVIITEAEKMAIEYEEQSSWAFKKWIETENDNLYYNIWRDNSERSFALLQLLNNIEPDYIHYILDGKMIREFA